MEFNRCNYRTIGRASILNIEEIEDWILNKMEKWFDQNWSKSCAETKHLSWTEGQQIGFFNLQNIPVIKDACNFEVSDNRISSDRRIVEIFKEEYNYLSSTETPFDLLYLDDNKRFCVIATAKNSYLLPVNDSFKLELFKTYEDIPVAEFKRLKGIQEDGSVNLVPSYLENLTKKDVKSSIEKKKSEIEKNKAQIEALKEEERKEIEKIKKEIEIKYAEKRALLDQKKAELEEKQKELKQELFILDTEIYSYQLYMGEVIDFKHIIKGENADINTPVVVYQKFRFLDVELGKWLSVFDFEGDNSEIKYFEDLIKHRWDIVELFMPTEKSVVFVKVSETGKLYSNDKRVANVIESYEKYHGNTIAIMIRNGKNVYISWTDEERLNLSVSDVFEKATSSTVNHIEDDSYYSMKSLSPTEVATRYFIYAAMQGVLDKGVLLPTPEPVNLLKPSKYLVLSYADGQISDNRFGTFDKILERTNVDLKKGDCILTVMHITRDDIYERYSSIRSWNNDRGIGNRNRTHDVHASNCNIYPINKVVTTENYLIKTLKYVLKIIEHKNVISSKICSISHEYLPTCIIPTLEEYDLPVIDHCLYGYKDDNVKGKNAEEIFEIAKDAGYFDFLGENRYCTFDNSNHDKGYIEHFYSISQNPDIKKECYISLIKTDSNWNPRTGCETESRANFLIQKGEYINLTFLNSIYIQYAIMNNQAFDINGKRIDFAAAVPYLLKALEHIREREEKEEKMLLSYLKELPNEWQVLLSEWKLKNDIHTLTDKRAKKFAEYLHKNS